VSVDSLDARHHDNFRHGAGALAATTESLERLRAHRLDFVIQTTAHRGNKDEIEQIVAWSAEQGAVSFNLYFLVATGRGARLADITTADYETLLASVVRWESEYRGRMMVRAKCAPHVMRHAHQADTSPHPHIPTSPFLNYATRCPCGTQYCRITPDGKLTPCPYIPTAAGDLRVQSFGDVWRDSPLFTGLRSPQLGGNCGKCEYRAVCGGCRARAFAATGDLFASDPSCEYEPTGLEALIAPRGTKSYGAAAAQTLPWTSDAMARMTRIPSFVRGVVMQRVEDYARRQGATAVTVELLAEVRSAMPVDFAKRAPFFVRDA
jgi:radical SAM protein with 4Fe4S-binding SPASM domain